MRPPSSASSSVGSPIIGSSISHHVNNPSLDLSLPGHVKNEDKNAEIAVVGEKVVNNHHSVPNGNNSRPPSSHNSMAGLPPISNKSLKPPLPPSSTYSDT